VGEEGGAELVKAATAGQMAFHRAMLRPATDREILIRLVRNLHLRFMQAESWEEALWTATHLILLDPGNPRPVKERAFVHLQRDERVEGQVPLRTGHAAIAPHQDTEDELARRKMFAHAPHLPLMSRESIRPRRHSLANVGSSGGLGAHGPSRESH